VLLPIAMPLAIPALLIAAIAGFEDVQVTLLVTFWLLPSLYIPVAVNCCFLPLAIDGLAGVTEIDDSTGGVTVNAAKPVTEPEAA
jgi:hypothetical protein